MKTLATVCLAAAGVIVATGCGSGHAGVTAARYSSARQVVAAMGRGGLHCANAYYGTPVVSGATSEASCNLSASESVLIDVFPGTVTTTMALRNSVSTGTQKIWVVVGPNWWVQTSQRYVKRVQVVLGGRIIGGPWHPPSAASATPVAAPPSSSPAVLSCGQRVQDWKGTPGAQAINQALTDLQSISADGQAANFAAVAADLDDLGAAASTMQGDPVPYCADPHRYWHQMTQAMSAAASESSGVANADSAAIQQATTETSQFQADAAALISELKQEGLW